MFFYDVNCVHCETMEFAKCKVGVGVGVGGSTKQTPKTCTFPKVLKNWILYEPLVGGTDGSIKLQRSENYITPFLGGMWVGEGMGADEGWGGWWGRRKVPVKDIAGRMLIGR